VVSNAVAISKEKIDFIVVGSVDSAGKNGLEKIDICVHPCSSLLKGDGPPLPKALPLQ
jgi:hypothetical protein